MQLSLHVACTHKRTHTNTHIHTPAHMSQRCGIGVASKCVGRGAGKLAGPSGGLHLAQEIHTALACMRAGCYCPCAHVAGPCVYTRTSHRAATHLEPLDVCQRRVVACQQVSRALLQGLRRHVMQYVQYECLTCCTSSERGQRLGMRAALPRLARLCTNRPVCVAVMCKRSPGSRARCEICAWVCDCTHDDASACLHALATLPPPHPAFLRPHHLPAAGALPTAPAGA